MLIKEFDTTLVYTFGNFFSNLMWCPALNHIQPSPSVLRFCTRGSADEEIVLEFTLEAVFLDMVGEGGWYLPVLE